MEHLSSFFQNKKILITGHTGFKGSWLTQVLINWGAQVSGISLRPNTSPSLFKILGLKDKIRNYFCDIRNFKKIKEIIQKEKPEIIFHLAAQPLVREGYNRPLETFETNIIGTSNILEAARDIGKIKAIILVTTDKVYENKEENKFFKEDDKLGGDDPYSASKAGAEIVISSYLKSFFNPETYPKKHTTLIASCRSGNVLGGGDWQKDRLIPDIIRAIFEKKEKIIIRNPKAIRPWQFVLEPLWGYLLLAKNLYEGKKKFVGPWNFGPSRKNYITVEELVKMSLTILGTGSYIVKKENSHQKEHQVLKIDNSKAKKFLKWQSKLNIKEILSLTLEWYRNYYEGKDIINLTNKQIHYFFNL